MSKSTLEYYINLYGENLGKYKPLTIKNILQFINDNKK